jgi:hypothetical protein
MMNLDPPGSMSDASFMTVSPAPALIARRLAARHGHFFKAEMLASQFANLEPPAPGETEVIVPTADRFPRLPLAAANERAGVLSILYVISYLAMGLPAVIGGFRVVHGGGVFTTAREYSIAVMALAALALVGRRVRRGAALAGDRARTARARRVTPAPDARCVFARAPVRARRRVRGRTAQVVPTTNPVRSSPGLHLGVEYCAQTDPEPCAVTQPTWRLSTTHIIVG